MNYGEICVLFLAVIPAMFADTDYCQANLCPKGKKHIACGNMGNFPRNCRKPHILAITPSYRSLIVITHNLLRSKIANGFEKFPPANRMATMLWDNELAKLAELNVKQCAMHQDECRNTPKFPFAGQNIASARWRKMELSVSEVIDGQIQTWFNQYNGCPLDVIKSYKKSAYRYNHFTVMVQEKSNRIGCAILRSTSCGFTQQLMACNYAYDNMLGTPVYSEGPTASKCATGTNTRFASLCSVMEKYN